MPTPREPTMHPQDDSQHPQRPQRPPKHPRQEDLAKVTALERPFAVADALQSGVSRERIRVGRGPLPLIAPFRGVRVPVSAPATLANRCHAYAVLMPDEYCFSHVTAARLWQIPLPRRLEAQTMLHVSAPVGKRAPRCRGVVGHQLAVSALRSQILGLPVTDPLSTWFALGSVLTLEELVVAADYLIGDPLVRRRDCEAASLRPFCSHVEIMQAAASYRGRGARMLRRAAALASELVESPMETRLRLLILKSDLPMPELNKAVYDEEGLIGYGDFVWEAYRLIGEYEGEVHREDEQRRRDIRRYERMENAGIRVIRIEKTAMANNGAEALARLRTALLRRGWLPEC